MQVTSEQESSKTDSSTQTLTASIESLLTTPTAGPRDSKTLFWLALSLAFSMLFALVALRQALAGPYVAQDDARQHVFWTARLADSELFQHDLIADYFQAIAPAGYAAVYSAAAFSGIDPFLFSKFLPMALGLLTTLFCFGVSMELLRVPSAAFLGSLVLNQGLWMRNGIVSATPRAFAVPLFLAFMFFMLRGSRRAALLAIALMGLFYPSIMFIAVGIIFLQLFKFDKLRPSLSRDRRKYLMAAAALAVAAIVLLPYALKTSGFGPVVTASEGRLMPEFLPGGRMAVFRQGFFIYWFAENRTGMLSASLFSPITACLGLLLPVLMLLPKWFPLARQISSKAAILAQVLAASLVMFFAANLLLFKLYLPSRYTVNSFRIVLALAAGLSAIIILDGVLKWSRRQTIVKPQLIGLSSIAALFAVMLAPTISGPIVDTRYKKGEAPGLYEFLSNQPKDILVASLSNEADNLPMFARRAILVGKETALPFHKGYYGQIRQRAIDLINAQYSPELSELQSFIRKYGINYLLIDNDAFTPEYLAEDKWIRQFQPAAKTAVARMKQGIAPVLVRYADQWAVIKTEGMMLIPADSILKASPEPVEDMPVRLAQ